MEIRAHGLRTFSKSERSIKLGSIAGLGLALLTTLATPQRAHAVPQIYQVFPGSPWGGNAYDVSADGSTVVGFSGVPGTNGSFVHRTGSDNVDYIPFSGAVAPANAVSYDGSVFAGGISGSPVSAYRLDSNGFTNLGSLNTAIGAADARGISADGAVVVGHSQHKTNRGQAFQWTEATGMQGLGFLPDARVDSSYATAVSADGNVIVGSGSSGRPLVLDEAFVWTAGTGMVGLGVVDQPVDPLTEYARSEARGISSDGFVIVGSSDFNRSGADPVDRTEAFRWTATGGMQGLGDLPGGAFHSIAADTTADGSVVVGSAASAQGGEAFVWSEAQGMRSLSDMLQADYNLDMSRWELWEATAISDDGLVIVGRGHELGTGGSVSPFVVDLREPGTTPSNPLLPDEAPDAGCNPSGTGFSFCDVVATGNLRTFLDPVVAAGYDFLVTEGSNFASVLIPDLLDDKTFTVSFDDGTGQSTYQILAGEEFDFRAHVSAGVRAFSILDIAPSLGLDPDDPLAFVTGVTFVDGSEFSSVTMTPRSVSVPVPSVIGFVVLGVGLLMQIRKRKISIPRSGT